MIVGPGFHVLSDKERTTSKDYPVLQCFMLQSFYGCTVKLMDHHTLLFGDAASQLFVAAERIRTV